MKKQLLSLPKKKTLILISFLVCISFLVLKSNNALSQTDDCNAVCGSDNSEFQIGGCCPPPNESDCQYMTLSKALSGGCFPEGSEPDACTEFYTGPMLYCADGTVIEASYKRVSSGPNGECNADPSFGSASCFCYWMESGLCGGSEPPPSGACSVAACQANGYSTATSAGCYSCSGDLFLGSFATDACDSGYECSCCGSGGGGGTGPVSCTIWADPVSGGAPFAVNFITVSGGDIDSFVLDFGDGQSASSADEVNLKKNHTYITAGNNLQPKLTVSNSENSAECLSTKINVTAYPAPGNLRKTKVEAAHMSGYTFIPGKITWSWNAPSAGATGYYLYASRVDNPTSEYYIGATTSASYSVSQFKPYTAGTFDYLIDGWPEPWNARYKLRVVAYKTVGDGTATSQSSDTAASSVEKPLSASYSNITNNSFSVQAQSGERGDSWGCTNPALAMCRQPFWFSYLTPNSSGVRLQAREIDNDVVSTSSWLKDNGTIAYGAYSLPPLWTVSGLTPNTTYNIYGQSRNQDAVSGRLGDYRPGPTDTDWQSLGTCSTTNVAAVNYTLTLTVVKLGTGTGTISAIPAGTPAITNTDCGPGGTCTASYATGNNVALSTAAGASSVFSGWSGDCTGTGVCDITMTANHNITATFAATGPANQPPGAPIFEPRP